MAEVRKADRPVVLAAHSSAGFLVQSVAAKIPDKIDHLIFNNAFVLPHGKCQFDIVSPDVAEGMTQAAVEVKHELYRVPAQIIHTRGVACLKRNIGNI